MYSGFQHGPWLTPALVFTHAAHCREAANTRHAHETGKPARQKRCTLEHARILPGGFPSTLSGRNTLRAGSLYAVSRRLTPETRYPRRHGRTAASHMFGCIHQAGQLPQKRSAQKGQICVGARTTTLSMRRALSKKAATAARTSSPARMVDIL